MTALALNLLALGSDEAWALNAGAIAVLHWLVNGVIFGSLVAGLTWLLVNTAFRRARPGLHAGLWLLVLLKFVLPVGPGWSYSLASLIDGIGPIAPPILPHASAQPPVEPRLALSETDDSTITLIPITAQPVAPAPAARPWRAPFLLGAAYLTALLIIGGCRLHAYLRFASRCRKLSPANDAARALVEGVCRRLGVRRMPRVLLSDDVPAPFIFGALHPTLVLARRQLDDLDELEAVVLHEIAHLRRGDLLVRYLQWFAGTLLFFWPVVAWVNRRIDLARERACDEWALRHGRLSPARYARCLLRAAQPVRSAWRSYTPAAMAANPSHVERRIEMILNTTTRSRRNRLLGAAAGLGLAGWAGFVLTGATGAAKPAAPPAAQTAIEEAGVWVVGPGQDGNCDLITNAPLMHFMPSATVQMIVAEGEADGAQTHEMAIAVVNGPGPARLAEFFEQHASADADGDGEVSKSEHDAYLIALALTAPQGVLAKYSDADRDGDGTLSATEAARLVAGGFAPPSVAGGKWVAANGGGKLDVLKHLPAELIARIHAAHGDDEGSASKKIKVTRTQGAGGQVREETSIDDGPAEVRVFQAGEEADGEVQIQGPDGQVLAHKVIVRAAADARDDDGQLLKVAIAGGGQGQVKIALPEPPAAWLLQNVDAAPSAEDVARYVPLAEAAPLAMFLELNPKADRNEDGVLTAAEREAFIEKHMSSMRTNLLARHPDADANSDGLLTNEEMHNFFRNLHGGLGSMKRAIFHAVDGDTQELEVQVQIEADDSSADE